MLIRDLRVADIVLLMKRDRGHRQWRFKGGLEGATAPYNFLAPSLAPHFSRKVWDLEILTYYLLQILMN